MLKGMVTSDHDWEQCGTCLNGPHVWRCKTCHEWTRSFDKPKCDAGLIDPDNGEHYSAKPCWTFITKR